jgi:hypothetical protein
MNASKPLCLFALAFFSFPSGAAAQAAPSEKNAPVACPCSDFRFTPKTDRARAVQEYWHEREIYKASMSIGSSLTLVALLSMDARGLQVARQSLKEEPKLTAARLKAVQLGGLKIRPGADVDHEVEAIFLIKGVDYEMKSS